MEPVRIQSEEQLSQVLSQTVKDTKIIDVHTHLFPEQFGDLCLAGIDELLTYHYLIAETMRQTHVPAERFWQLSKGEQAELVWSALFVQNSPVSEATQGIITILQTMGITCKNRDLNEIRRQFAAMRNAEYIDMIFEYANVEKVVMTNDPLDKREVKYLSGAYRSERFLYSLRLDQLVNHWQSAAVTLQSMGYPVKAELTAATLTGAAKFLKDWIEKLQPVYVALSLPPDFSCLTAASGTILLQEVVLPVCAEYQLPLALMVGAKRAVNPELKLAGDAVGKADVGAIIQLCSTYPQNKFLLTMLSREDQYELTVAARKFSNLMLFGCWWFLNTPQFVDEITRMRFELLGTSFIPQHSDCRVLEHLIYKWQHSLPRIEQILREKYSQLIKKSWPVAAEDIQRDVNKLFRENFTTFIRKS
ncbi:MAG: hypothetical protein ABFC84_18010 [Veillonellales bacterium]